MTFHQITIFRPLHRVDLYKFFSPVGQITVFRRFQSFVFRRTCLRTGNHRDLMIFQKLKRIIHLCPCSIRSIPGIRIHQFSPVRQLTLLFTPNVTIGQFQSVIIISELSSRVRLFVEPFFLIGIRPIITQGAG